MMTLIPDISVHILIIQYMKSLGNGMRYTVRGAKPCLPSDVTWRLDELRGLTHSLSL